MPSPLAIFSYPHAILHIDGDAFFASCEQNLHPELKGKPVVTGKERGIVASLSYEAKALGIKRGMPLHEIHKICPSSVILPSDYETYSLFSERMFEIMRRFTPDVEEYSIDEGFCDITGLRRVFRASYKDIALRIKKTLEDDLGNTFSCGLAPSKVLAKIASKWRKPSGFSAIPGFRIHEFLKDLKVIDVWGIGENTAAYFKKLGIKTALDFARLDENFVKKHFDLPHHEIWQELRGQSVYKVNRHKKTKYLSICKSRTFTPPSFDKRFVFAQLLSNLENACIKARRFNLKAKELVVFLKKQDFVYRGLKAKLSRPTNFPNEFCPIVESLFKEIFETRALYRATGVVLANLVQSAGSQISLFEEPLKLIKLQRVYQAIDRLDEKFGKHTVYLAASQIVKSRPRFFGERQKKPPRQINLLKGENKRQRLGIPLFGGKVV